MLMASLMIVGIVAALRAPDPVDETAPRTIGDAIVRPFVDFFQRTGPGWGILILLFIVFYQLPDRFAQNMATPFLLQIGFSQTEIGAIHGGIGIAATIVGVLAGGALVAKLGLNRSVWIVAALQILSNLAYYWIAVAGANEYILVVAIIIENLAGGMVTAVFVALLMSLCSKQFSATQYALLSSLMAAARDVIVAPAGRVAEMTGWPTFFLLTLVVGIPALLLLPVLVPWGGEAPRGAAVHTGEVREGG
jgi:PAT family beta-lactamase induction signal transducer AmpG